MKGFFVTGTDTSVGKTELSAILARHFREKGLKVGVMKAIATGVKGPCRDAIILKKAAGSKMSIDDIAPIRFKAPLAPLVAARLEKKDVDLGRLWKKFRAIASFNDIVIVEGIGGLMVPIKKQKKNRIIYTIDLIKKMRLPVILVARPGLGTINHTLMSIKILRFNRLKIAGVVFNYTRPVIKDISARTNPFIIKELSGVKVLGIVAYNKKRENRRIRWLDTLDF